MCLEGKQSCDGELGGLEGLKWRVAKFGESIKLLKDNRD